MTEPQQKDFEELLEQLRQEEEVCESCPNKNTFADKCEGCGTHGNIQDLEQLIASMETDAPCYAGLYIEMKYGKNKPTDNQKQWIADLTKQGYKVVICWSGEEATQVLEAYLQQSETILTDPLNEPCRPQKRIEIYCSSEDTESIKNALTYAAAHGECCFGAEFMPEDCFDATENTKECAQCVLENIKFCEYE